MDFFTSALDTVKTVVCGLGAVMAIIGIINFSQGHGQHNASKKEEGLGQFIGGGSIFLVGLVLVPKLAQFFSI